MRVFPHFLFCIRFYPKETYSSQTLLLSPSPLPGCVCNRFLQGWMLEITDGGSRQKCQKFALLRSSVHYDEPRNPRHPPRQSPREPIRRIGGKEKCHGSLSIGAIPEMIGNVPALRESSEERYEEDMLNPRRLPVKTSDSAAC